MLLTMKPTTDVARLAQRGQALHALNKAPLSELIAAKDHLMRAAYIVEQRLSDVELSAFAEWLDAEATKHDRLQPEYSTLLRATAAFVRVHEGVAKELAADAGG